MSENGTWGMYPLEPQNTMTNQVLVTSTDVVSKSTNVSTHQWPNSIKFKGVLQRHGHLKESNAIFPRIYRPKVVCFRLTIGIRVVRWTKPGNELTRFHWNRKRLLFSLFQVTNTKCSTLREDRMRVAFKEGATERSKNSKVIVRNWLA